MCESCENIDSVVQIKMKANTIFLNQKKKKKIISL